VINWNWKKVVLCLVAIGFAVALRWMAVDAGTRSPGATYSQFLNEVRQGKVDMQGGSVNIEIQDTSSGLQRMLLNAIPFLILLGIWLFMMGKLRSCTRIA